MAAGLPVVISDQVGIYREVVEGNAGKVVPCHVDALADAMGQLAADPELCAAMGGDARRLAEQRYSIDTMASQLKRVYGELSQRPRGSAR